MHGFEIHICSIVKQLLLEKIRRDVRATLLDQIKHLGYFGDGA